MSQENVEIVKCLYRAWAQDGFGVVPELMDPAVEWVNPDYAVEPGVRHGYDGFEAAAKAFSSVYESYRMTSAKFYEVGDRVAVRATLATSSRGQGVPIKAERGYVFEIHRGKVVRFAWFNHPAEALKAVGLEE